MCEVFHRPSHTGLWTQLLYAMSLSLLGGRRTASSLPCVQGNIPSTEPENQHPSGDSEGLSSSGLSCKPVSGSPRASSGVSSLHKPTNKATSRQELSQDSWPPILPYMPGRKGGHLPICSQLGIQPPPPPPPFPLPSPDSPVDSLLRLPALLASWERNGLSRPL